MFTSRGCSYELGTTNLSPEIADTLSAIHPKTPPKVETKLAVNVAEACRLLSVSRPTLYRLIKRGLVHPSRATRHLLFSVKELERFLADTSKPITI